jgi:hypothetical protein
MLLCLLSPTSRPLGACIHSPVGYKDVVTEKTKEALLFHDGKNAHLVIKTELESDGALPPTMAWVIPLPSLPSSYKEERADLFEKLFELTPSPMRGSAATPGTTSIAVPTAEEGIKVHAAQTVGRYQVQPIEVLSETSGTELNRWLSRNGFGAVPAENQKYYLKKGTVFLTLKLNGLHGSRTQIKPLHIIYASNTLSVPLKFSSHSGVFRLSLYTWSQQPVKIVPAAANSYMHVAAVGKFDTNSEPILRQLFGSKTGYLTRFESGSFNSPGWEVANMKSDPVINTVGNAVLKLPQQPVVALPAAPASLFFKVALGAGLLLTAFLMWFKLRRAKKRAA